MKQARSHVGMRAGTRRAGRSRLTQHPTGARRPRETTMLHPLIAYDSAARQKKAMLAQGSCDRSGPHCAASGSLVMVVGPWWRVRGRTAGRYWLWSDEVAAATSESTWLRMAGLGAEPACGHCGVIDGAGLRSRLVTPPAGGDGRRTSPARQIDARFFPRLLAYASHLSNTHTIIF